MKVTKQHVWLDGKQYSLTFIEKALRFSGISYIWYKATKHISVCFSGGLAPVFRICPGFSVAALGLRLSLFTFDFICVSLAISVCSRSWLPLPSMLLDYAECPQRNISPNWCYIISDFHPHHDPGVIWMKKKIVQTFRQRRSSSQDSLRKCARGHPMCVAAAQQRRILSLLTTNNNNIAVQWQN